MPNRAKRTAVRSNRAHRTHLLCRGPKGGLLSLKRGEGKFCPNHLKCSYKYREPAICCENSSPTYTSKNKMQKLLHKSHKLPPVLLPLVGPAGKKTRCVCMCTCSSVCYVPNTIPHFGGPCFVIAFVHDRMENPSCATSDIPSRAPHGGRGDVGLPTMACGPARASFPHLLGQPSPWPR